MASKNIIEILKEKLILLDNFLNIPPKRCWLDISTLDYVNKFEGKKVLNLGAGAGIYDNFIKVKTLNLDIISNERIHVVADAHSLPFKEGAFDCIFSNAVLEHVQYPWIVADECRRALKDGGIVCVNVPFLFIIHDKHDYFRFTQDGLRACFKDFEEIQSGVCIGPMSFLVVYLGEMFSTLIKIKIIGFIARLVFKLFLYPLFYIDRFTKGKKKWDKFATLFYFIGRKG